jgi:hypothetical protein
VELSSLSGRSSGRAVRFCLQAPAELMPHCVNPAEKESMPLRHSGNNSPMPLIHVGFETKQAEQPVSGSQLLGRILFYRSDA